VRRSALPVIAWLSVLLMLGLVLLRPPGIGRERVDAERMRVIDLTTPVAFPMDADEQRVKLLTWLARPASWARDVRATAPYALEYTLLDPDGEVVLTDVVWHRTRESWIGGPDGLLLRPTWLPAERDEVSDSRSLELDLTGLVPRGGLLRVRARHMPPGTRVLAIAYRHSERTPAARLRFLAGGSPEHNERLARRLTSGGWASLPMTWRNHLAARVWERLSPLPAPGTGVLQTVELMHAAPDVPAEGQAALGLPVPPGGAVSVNLLKGAVLRGRWLDVSGRSLASAPTWLQEVQIDGTSTLRFLGDVEQLGPFSGDAPLQSIQLALDPAEPEPRILQLHLDQDPADAVWGDPPVVEDPAGGWRIAPDLRTLELFRIDEGLSPLRFPIQGAEETLRLTLRPRLPGGPLHGFGLRWSRVENTTEELPADPLAEVPVEISALDADGETLARWETTVLGLPSAFERYTQGDDPMSGQVGEPEQRYLVPPTDAVILAVRAARPLDVALRTRKPGNASAEVARGYAAPPGLAPPPTPDDSPLPTWHARGEHDSAHLPLARYEPYAQDSWRARNPDQLATLVAEGRVVRIDGQVRLEPAGIWDSTEWLARRAPDASEDELLLPPGPPTRGSIDLPGPFALIAEPDRDGSATDGARTRLSLSKAVLEVGRSGRLDIDYRVDVSQAGSEAVVRVDGTDHPERLLATSGRLRIAGLSPGLHRVWVDTPGLFLARARGRPAWQVRRVVRLQPGRSVEIPVPATAGSVAIYTYGGGGWIDWSLRGGGATPGPAMMKHSTRRTGRHALRGEGAAAAPLSRSGALMPRLTPLVIFINDDVAAASSTLSLELTGTAEPVWIRAAATWAACPGGGCEQQGASRARVGAR